jgi:hypothetical protein
LRTPVLAKEPQFKNMREAYERAGLRPNFADDPNVRFRRVVAVQEKPEKPRKGRKRKRES